MRYRELVSGSAVKVSDISDLSFVKVNNDSGASETRPNFHTHTDKDLKIGKIILGRVFFFNVRKSEKRPLNG